MKRSFLSGPFSARKGGKEEGGMHNHEVFFPFHCAAAAAAEKVPAISDVGRKRRMRISNSCFFPRREAFPASLLCLRSCAKLLLSVIFIPSLPAFWWYRWRRRRRERGKRPVQCLAGQGRKKGVREQK